MALQAQITVDPMSIMDFCPGATFTIGFTATGTFNAGNVFTAELSDATGSFVAPTVIGASAATTSGNVNCTIPAAAIASSTYLLRVSSSDLPLTGVPYGATLTIHPLPFAGTNGSVTLCSSANSVDVPVYLGGTPDPGGVVTVLMGAGVVMGTIYAGAFNGDQVVYTVTDANGCSASATLFIGVNMAPNAGVNTNINVCSSSTAFSMFAQLGGSPDAGGLWTSPGGSPHPNSFNPVVDPAGCYVYIVPGVAPCMNASSVLCITATPAPNAGTNTTLSWCQGDGPFTMLTQLNGGPQAGGSWTDPFSDPHSSTFTPGVDPNGLYTYTIPASGGCPGVSATLDVTVITTCLTTTPVGNLPTY
ncbi:MAG: hypothetical protein JNM31_00815 [Flavobacteriales bacterium]|nr:hypothetical protein [Flavobacteriales bacterium]